NPSHLIKHPHIAPEPLGNPGLHPVSFLSTHLAIVSTRPRRFSEPPSPHHLESRGQRHSRQPPAARRGDDQADRLSSKLPARHNPVQCILQRPWHAVSVLGGTDEHRLGPREKISEGGDRLGGLASLDL